MNHLAGYLGHSSWSRILKELVDNQKVEANVKINSKEDEIKHHIDGSLKLGILIQKRTQLFQFVVEQDFT